MEHIATVGRPVMTSARLPRTYWHAYGTNGLVISVAVLALFYVFVQTLDVPWLIDLANLTGPVVLGLTATVTGANLIRRQPLAIWTPYAWFLGGVVLFYSFGPLVYVLGSDAVLTYVRTSLPITVTNVDVLRTNLLNAVGVISILIGLMLAHSIWRGPRPMESIEDGTIERAKRLTLWLLIIGGGLQYFLVLPWEFGVYEFILPGIVYNLGKLFLFGLMGLSYVVARGVRHWKVLLYLLWPLQVLISILHFSKADLMLSLLLPVLGIYLAKRRLKHLLLAAFVMALGYVSVAHLIHYGRQEIFDLSGNIKQATIGQRLEILGRWISGEAQSLQSAESSLSRGETGWARLSYVHVQSFAMERYDSGMPGGTLTTALIVLIPRAIWPEKPVTTDMAKDFYELVTGWRGETHLGLGLFGEGYWNLGWLGVILLGLATGTVFSVVSAYAVRWMRVGAFEYMPGIFLGINMGILGTTQLFANAIVGGTGLIVVYALVVSKALSVMVGRPK